MKIDVGYVAELARLELTDEEKAAIFYGNAAGIFPLPGFAETTG